MRLKKSKLGVAMLVMTGLAIEGNAYVPVPKPRATKEFISRTYVRSTGEQRWLASEARKKEILNNLSTVKKEIRLKAESYRIDRNTVVTGITATQKLNIHSMKLMARIADCKNCI